MRKTNVYTDDSFKSSGLKTFLRSKRTNTYYLQYYPVLKKDGRLLYSTEDNKANQYFNTLVANTISILLVNRWLRNNYPLVQKAHLPSPPHRWLKYYEQYDIKLTRKGTDEKNKKSKNFIKFIIG